MAAPAFNIVAELTFKTLGEVALDKSVEKMNVLADSVDRAQRNIKQLGISYALSFTGYAGGILGVLGKATEASEKFKHSQLDLMKIFDSNRTKIQGMTDNRAFAGQMIKELTDDAFKFGLEEGALVDTFKSMSFMLVNKGLAGDNFQNARKLSRDVMKSAPVMELEPSMIGGQLVRMIEGTATQGDTAFRRLMTDAPEAFKIISDGQEKMIKNARQFNQLKTAERLKIVMDGFGKLTQNSEILAERAKTLSAVFRRMHNLFSGFNSVLKPIGDILIKVIVQFGNIIADWVHTKGRMLVKAIAKLMEGMIDEPRKMITRVLQLKEFGKDSSWSRNITMGIAMAAMVVPFLPKLIGGVFKAVNFLLVQFPPLAGLATKALSAIGSIVAFIKGGLLKILLLIKGISLGVVAGLFIKFGAFIVALGALFAGFLAVKQAWTKASAELKVERAEAMIAEAEKLPGFMDRVQKAVSPMLFWWNRFVNFLSGIFKKFRIGGLPILYRIIKIVGDIFLDWFEWGSRKLDLVLSLATGFAEDMRKGWENIFGWIGIGIDHLMEKSRSFLQERLDKLPGQFQVDKKGMITKKSGEGAMSIGGALKPTFLEKISADAREMTFSFLKNVGLKSTLRELQDMEKRHLAGPEQDERETAQRITNYYGDFHIKQDFKARQEPDRIAFALKQVIENASNNRSQSRHQGISTPLRGGAVGNS